jgi:ethanolamine utilization protein EutA (predicted chaperonin)
VAADPPLLLVLVACDVAKALGGYATGWGSAHRHVAVIDEVAVPRAHFVRIGRAHHGAVPVSFHGLYG